jgi:ACR3 family arsenite efflux pump ArsB
LTPTDRSGRAGDAVAIPVTLSVFGAQLEAAVATVTEKLTDDDLNDLVAFLRIL